MNSIRVAVLGVLAPHKGQLLVRAVVDASSRTDAPIDLVLIGFAPRFDDAVLPFRATGSYAQTDLQAIIEHENPDVIWFPVQIPETYSFTLTDALISGRPLLVPDLGAFPERVGTDPSTVCFPPNSSPRDVLALLHRAARLPRIVRDRPSASDFYARAYLRPERKIAQSPAVPPIVTYETRLPGGQFDACAYIRVRLPLRHPGIAIAPVSSMRDGELPCDATGVLVQRTAIGDAAFAKRLVAWCRARGIPLVYETDDDLLDVTQDHPEYDFYAPRVAAAQFIIEAADAVFTSTELLAAALHERNAKVCVIPNALDERLWYDEPVADSAPRSSAQAILYMGTATHAGDLDVVREAIGRLHSRTLRRLTFDVIGITPDDEPWFHRVVPPRMAGISYPSFVRWLRAKSSEWQVGIAPLRPSEFNERKSAIKALDYGAIGLPVLASDANPYRSLAREGAPLMATIPHDADAWRDALQAVAHDTGESRELGRSMRAWVREHATLGATAAARRSALIDAFALHSNAGVWG